MPLPRYILIDVYSFIGILHGVKLVELYQSLADETRLRLMHLLAQGPLCVCHFQDIMRAPQVKISKHLAYLKKRGVVEATRHQNWVVYSLPARTMPALKRHLQCLADSVRHDPLFQADVKRLRKIAPRARRITAGCCSECA